MMASVQKTKTLLNRKRKHIILVSLAFIFLLGVATFTYFFLKPVPQYPLGDGLEYLGEKEYGCYGPCDSLPSWTYYYGTDMNPEELANYFKAKDHSIESYSDFIGIELKLDNSDNPLDIFYYKDKQEPELKPTTKKHFIKIDSEDYQAAKDSL